MRSLSVESLDARVPSAPLRRSSRAGRWTHRLIDPGDVSGQILRADHVVAGQRRRALDHVA